MKSAWEQRQAMPGFGTCRKCGQKRRGYCLDMGRPCRKGDGCSAGWIPRKKNARRGWKVTKLGAGWSVGVAYE
jgi:hypothetical protein